MQQSCLVSVVQAGGRTVIVWSCKYRSVTLYCFCVNPFTITALLSSDGYFKNDNTACNKAQIISNWFLEHDDEFTVISWPPWWTRFQSNNISLGFQPTDLQLLFDAIASITDKNIWGRFLTPCWINATNNWGSSERKSRSSQVLTKFTYTYVCESIIMFIHQSK